MAFFELVNTFSGNRIGAYDAWDEAVEDVRLTVERCGECALGPVALGYEDDEGHTTLLADGDELLAGARPTGREAVAI